MANGCLFFLVVLIIRVVLSFPAAVIIVLVVGAIAIGLDRFNLVVPRSSKSPSQASQK